MTGNNNKKINITIIIVKIQIEINCVACTPRSDCIIYTVIGFGILKQTRLFVLKLVHNITHVCVYIYIFEQTRNRVNRKLFKCSSHTARLRRLKKERMVCAYQSLAYCSRYISRSGRSHFIKKKYICIHTCFCTS